MKQFVTFLHNKLTLSVSQFPGNNDNKSSSQRLTVHAPADGEIVLHKQSCTDVLLILHCKSAEMRNELRDDIFEFVIVRLCNVGRSTIADLWKKYLMVVNGRPTVSANTGLLQVFFVCNVFFNGWKHDLNLFVSNDVDKPSWGIEGIEGNVVVSVVVDVANTDVVPKGVFKDNDVGKLCCLWRYNSS